MRKLIFLLVFLLLVEGLFAVQYDGIKSNPQCSDGKDNDGDGLIDYPDDKGCSDLTDDREKTSCQDGKDNDNDGLIDMADPGCYGIHDDSEKNKYLICQDGKDNDNDGLLDMADPGCKDVIDMDETDPVIVCGSGSGKNVYLTVDFLKSFNSGTGNLDSKVYADNGVEVFNDEQQIPLVVDGVPVMDTAIINDVPGVAIQRGNGWVYFLLQGKHLPKGSGLESLDANLHFTKEIKGFLNSTKLAEVLENQGDGISEWKNPNQDEVTPNIGSKKAKWVSTVDTIFDGFYLWYDFDDVIYDTGCIACQDGKDNDGDGLIDMNDPGCSSVTDNSELNPAVQCDDGKDNDNDGLIDMADPGCSSVTDNNEKDIVYQCSDGKDNDGDTYIDYPNDKGCSDVTDNSELNSLIQCDNGLDDDGDGLIDYPDDLGCSSPLDNSEFGMVINGSKFEPLLWSDPNSRKVYKSAMDGNGLSDRGHNYAFEGEQVKWEVLVMDKNGIEKIKDVYVSMGKVQGPGNDIEANCKLKEVLVKGTNINRFNAKIGQEKLKKVTADNTFAIYTCLFTVETQSSMHGEHWVTVEAEDLDGLIGSLDENEYWFFNPYVSIGILGELNFGELMPGHTLYSDTILLRNGAEDGSGVELNMYISGTDFYDPGHSGAKCPVTNKLDLTNFGYYAVNGAYSSATNPGADIEGYDGIVYGNIVSNSETIIGGLPYQAVVNDSNVLNEGSELSITFRLKVPEPCNGAFSDGDIFFWFDVI